MHSQGTRGFLGRSCAIDFGICLTKGDGKCFSVCSKLRRKRWKLAGEFANQGSTKVRSYVLGKVTGLANNGRLGMLDSPRRLARGSPARLPGGRVRVAQWRRHWLTLFQPGRRDYNTAHDALRYFYDLRARRPESASELPWWSPADGVVAGRGRSAGTVGII